MKVRTAALGLLLSAALAACSSAPAAAPPADSGSSSSSASSSEPVTVTVMTWEGADTNAAVDKALAAFESSHPNIKVQRVPSPAGNYGDKVQSMVLANTLPDIFWAGNDTAQQFGAQGLLYDWSQNAKASSGLDMAKFAPAAIENWTGTDGQLYGLPTLMNTYGIWYNADLFKAAGVPLPEPGWTYDDLMAAAKALTVKDGDSVTRYGLYATGDETIFSPWTVSNCGVSAGGQPFMDKIINPTKITADAQFLACAQKFADAVQAGSITPPGYSGDGLTDSFIAGQIPMLYNGQWLAPSFITAKPAFTYGFAPLPIVKDRVQPYDAVGIVSPKTIKNPDAVWQVAQFLASGAWETVLVGAPVAPAAYVPSASPYFDTLSKAGLASVADSVRFELEAPNKQGIRFTAPWSSKANDLVKANWNPALTGDKPLQPAVTTMVDEINKLIAAGQ